MFCRRCGTQLPDGSSFCSKCGENLGAPIAYAPIANGGNDAASEFFNSFFNVFKNFFTKGPKVAVQKAGEKSNLIWIIFTAISMVFCGLSLGITFRDGGFFGITFIWGFFLSLLGSGAIFGMTCLLLNTMLKTKVNFLKVANACSVAFLPVTIIFVLNMIFGIFSLGMVAILYIIALIYSFTLLSHAIETFSSHKLNDLAFVISMVATVTVVGLIFWLIFREYIVTAFLYTAVTSALSSWL